MSVPDEHVEFATRRGDHTHVTALEVDEFHNISIKCEGDSSRCEALVAEIKRN